MDKLNTKKLSFDVYGYIKELSLNPLLKGINIDVNNCNMLSDYVEDYNNCKSCKGLEHCNNKVQGYYSKLNEEDMTLTKLPCKLMKKKLVEERKEKNFSSLFLPKSLHEASFNDYNLTSESRAKVFNYMKSFASSFKRGTLTKGVYLYGKFQVGKTYTLACACNLFAEHEIESLLVYFPDLVRDLKASMANGTLEERINRLKTVDVLMLDDVGAELISPWLRDEILCPILNYRLQEKLPLFISSNLNPNELRDHFKKCDGDDYNAERIITRIASVALHIEFKNE